MKANPYRNRQRFNLKGTPTAKSLTVPRMMRAIYVAMIRPTFTEVEITLASNPKRKRGAS